MDLDLSKIEGFDWDNGNLEHIKKHNVEYTECEEAFLSEDPTITEDESYSQAEERYRVYGETSKGRLLVIIITLRENEQSSSTKRIRVISARDQNKKERKEYREEGESI